MRSEVVQRSGEVIMIRDRKYNEKNHQTYISSEIQIPQYQIDLGLVQVQCHSALVLGFDSNFASSLGDIVAAVLATFFLLVALFCSFSSRLFLHSLKAT